MPRALVREIAGAARARGRHRASPPGGGGADIGPLVRAGRVPSASLEVEGSRYFTYHHTPADTLERLDPGELQRCTAAVAVLAYVAADLEEALPREEP